MAGQGIYGRALKDLTDPRRHPVTRKAGEQLADLPSCATTAAPSPDAGSTAVWDPPGISWRGATTQTRPASPDPELGLVRPANRRVMYNRASCDPSGKTFNPQASSSRGMARMERRGRADYKADEEPSLGMGPFIMKRGRRRTLLRARQYGEGPSPSTTSPSRPPAHTR